MANSNIPGNENILVKVDQNNIVFIDPNSVVENGDVKTRNVQQENLVIYVNLEADLIERTVLAVNNTEEPSAKSSLLSVAKGTLNMLKNNNGNDFDTTWTNSFIENTKTTTNNGKTTKTFVDSMADSSAQSFGIESVNITIAGANFIPQININFIDVRGKTLFESPKNSPYSAFFHLPWPIFYLTVKGFYGKAIRYRLHLVDFSSSFNGTTGNFDINTTFVGSTYAYLNDIPLDGAFTAPYLYSIEKDRKSTTVEKQVTNNGKTTTEKTTTTKINISKNSKGYQMLHSVYQEYIQKGLLPKNFRTITLSELVNKAKSLDMVIEQSIFKGVDAKVFAGIKEYEDTLNDFETSLNAWKSSYTDTKPITVGNKVYYPLKASLNGKTDSVFNTSDANSLVSILKSYPEKLSKSAIFIDKFVKDKTNASFKGLSFVYKNYIQDVGKYTLEDSPNFLVNISGDETNPTSILNDLYRMFASFVEQRDKFQKKIEELINNVIRDSKTGLGFEPTVRNVIGVLLANADVYVRLLKDVHTRAFNAGAKRKDKVTPMCNETIGKNEVYPWPEITKASSGSKQKVIVYPGDESMYRTLGSNDPSLWPEVEFVENYIAVSTKRVDPKADKEGGVNKVDFVFEQDEKYSKTKRISTLFQLWDDAPYVNKTLSSVLFEIWERARYATFYDSYDLKVVEEIAKIESENLKECITEDLDIIEMLKSVLTVNKDDNAAGITDSYHKFLAYLDSFSPFERAPYLKDFLPTVPYVKDIITQSFTLEQYGDATIFVNNDKDYPKLSTFIKSYEPEKYRADIYPFKSPTYLSYLNLTKFDKVKQLRMSNILNVNTEDGLISTSNNLKWVKSGFEDNLFKNQITFPNQTKVHILNTPYFHKALLYDVSRPVSYAKYVGSAYLLLNSLPFKDLSDTMIDETTKSEVMLSTMFKEAGASHTIPYHLICKWGSIYHRYKNYVLDGGDILSGFTTSNMINPISGSTAFDDNAGLTYVLYGKNVSDDTNDIGIHPFYDDVFYQVVNGYSFFDPHAGSVEYNEKIDNGIVKNRIRTKVGTRYYTNYIQNFNIDATDAFYTLLPCDGANTPDTNLNVNKDLALDAQNGYRILWYTGETANVDYSNKKIPSPYEYMSTLVTGGTRNGDNIYGFADNYRKVIDLIATFSPEILDKFEETFLEFASENLNLEIPYVRYPNVSMSKFQDLLKSIVTVGKSNITSTETDAVIKELSEKQGARLKTMTTAMLAQNSLMKLTISNPKDIDINILGGFVGFEKIRTSYGPYQEYKYEDNKKYIDLYIGEELDITKKYKRFFMDNNIDLNEQNVRALRPLVYIYAGGMAHNFNTPEGFKVYLTENIILPYTTRNRLFIDLIIRGFKDLQNTNGGSPLSLYKGYNTEINKINMYSDFKSFNDKWVAGNSIGQRLLLEEFLFIDRANRDIGDNAYVDIGKIISLDDSQNTKTSIYSAIGTLIEGSNFIFRGLPAYVNFYGSNLSTKSKLEGSKKTARNIFGTFLEVDYQEASPKMIIQYVGPTSKHLDMEYIQDKMKFKNDSGNLFDMNASPLIITNNDILKTGDLNKSNKVVAFEISIGDQANGLFKGIKLDQATLRNSYASQIVNENMGRSETGSGVYQVDIGLFDIYRQVSYTCEVTMMGCAMIQPSMYFYLKNVPMFKGSYWITEVKHNIRNNGMETSFTGYRMPYAALPDPKDSIMLAYRALFESITNKAIALVKSENTNIASKSNVATQNDKNIIDQKGKQKTINEGDPKALPKNFVETKINKSDLYNEVIPYNGYEGEKLIQLVKLEDGVEWLKAVACTLGGKNNSLDDNTAFYIATFASGTQTTWKNLKGFTDTASMYTTKFKQDHLNELQITNLQNKSTVFLNPYNNKTLNVTHSLCPNCPIPNGPIGIGPNSNKYGIALSKAAMSRLGLYEGQTVYFRFK
jgi:hypothetical protein